MRIVSTTVVYIGDNLMAKTGISIGSLKQGYRIWQAGRSDTNSSGSKMEGSNEMKVEGEQSGILTGGLS